MDIEFNFLVAIVIAIFTLVMRKAAGRNAAKQFSSLIAFVGFLPILVVLVQWWLGVTVNPESATEITDKTMPLFLQYFMEHVVGIYISAFAGMLVGMFIAPILRRR